MFSLNRVELIGYQTQPLTLRQTPAGTSVVDLNLVVPYSFQNARGESLAGRSFHTVTVWGGMADIAGQYVKPCAQIFVSGRLQTDSWEDTQSGEKRSKTKVVALDMILLDPKDGQTEPPSDAGVLLQCLNRAQVIGNVTRDPEIRTTTSGVSVLTLSVATNERWRDKASQESKERTEFHSVVIWGDLAKAVQHAVRKGQRIYVSGRVQTRTWETQAGQKRATTEIIADHVSLLGTRNTEILASVRTDASAAVSPAEPEPALVAAAAIPSVKYESEIKPEDLPF
ncbi:MAG: single-stranded DNA-binding protein [Candidatus Peribacteraceae bacterium]